jgi:energy-coupling factor transport system ATP-binding protein
VENGNPDISNKNETKLKNNKTFNIVMLISIIILIPCTIWFGVTKLNNRKYYFISLLIILEMLLPVFATYERKKPKLMEMVLTACMCALTVIGRAAFYMTPNFKPCIALVIITGIALGPFDGFVTGALSMLISNMLFMQGPWTPWQMLAMGLVGFFAGLIGKNKLFRQSKVAMCVFGALACFLIYGLIMNPASVIMYQGEITKGMLIASYTTGFPMDAVQAAATIIFLFLGAKPILNKLKRVMKYMQYEA